MSDAHGRIVPFCVEALENYRQADMDGIMVLVSRQAIHETIDAYWARVKTCEELEAKLQEFQKSQSYSYIGRDMKTVLARDLEDRAETAEAKLAKAVEALDKLARLGNGEKFGNSDGNMTPAPPSQKSTEAVTHDHRHPAPEDDPEATA